MRFLLITLAFILNFHILTRNAWSDGYGSYHLTGHMSGNMVLGPVLMIVLITLIVIVIVRVLDR